MKFTIFKFLRLLSIAIGAILLIYQIGTSEKNYYLQSVGILLLMGGVYFVTLSNKPTDKEEES